MTKANLSRVARSGLAAASLVNVALWHSWKWLLDPVHTVAAGLLPTAVACWAAVTLCLLAFLGGALVSALIGQTPSSTVGAARDVLLLGCSLILANVLRVSSGLSATATEAWVRRHEILLLIVPLLTIVALRWRRPLAHRFYQMLLIASPFLLVTVGRASLIALRTDFAALDPTRRSLGLSAPRPGVRVVVVIFDEMDFGFAFASRPSTLALPSFDHLRRRAFFATDAHSPETHTSLSIPSYLVGQAVDSIISTTNGEQFAHVRGQRRASNLYEIPTMFDDAYQLGARSEVVGFYIPYCRWPFARRLERCTWRPFSRGGVLDYPMDLPDAVVRQVLLLLLGNRAGDIKAIRTLTTAGVRAASDSALRLVFVHLPVPHMPAVWNERTGHFTTLSFRSSSYFDNLALADHILARIVDAIRQAGLDDRTVLLVTSDHPWRFGPIEGIAPGDRVPFIVRFPDAEGLEWAPRFETVRLRSLVRLLLGGEIRSAAGVAAWAVQNDSAHVTKPGLHAPRS